MTRTQWKQLPEREREAIRQASAEASLHDFERQRRRSDFERALEVWAARDAYLAECVVVGCGVLLLAGWLLVFVGVLSR